MKKMLVLLLFAPLIVFSRTKEIVLVVKGVTDPGAEVRIWENRKVISMVKSGADGKFSVEISLLIRDTISADEQKAAKACCNDTKREIYLYKKDKIGKRIRIFDDVAPADFDAIGARVEVQEEIKERLSYPSVNGQSLSMGGEFSSPVKGGIKWNSAAKRFVYSTNNHIIIENEKAILVPDTICHLPSRPPRSSSPPSRRLNSTFRW